MSTVLIHERDEMRTQDIFERQVQTLVWLVQQWHHTGGADGELEVRVRNFVSGELIGRGTAEVTARALSELNDQEADRLNDMVNHCSQTFYRTDAIWRAFAFPVAVHWHMKHDSIYIAHRGDQDCLDELASGVRQCVGAQAVFLDSRPYSARALFMANARNLHDHLQHLVIGAPRTAAALNPMDVRSASEPPWRVVYFLGVEVVGAKARGRLDEPCVRDALQSYLHLGAEALTMPKSAMFALCAHGHTVCHSPLYLHDAIRFGEKALRGYRLRQMLEEIAKGEACATLHFTVKPLRQAVDLLLSGVWLAFELRWELYPEETMDDFIADAETALTAGAEHIECSLVGLEFEEFQVVRAATSVDCCRMRNS